MADPVLTPATVEFVLPGVIWFIKLLISAIVTIGGLLCTVIWWVGKSFVKQSAATAKKVDAIHHVLMACDGCAESYEREMNGQHRRSGDGGEEGSW